MERHIPLIKVRFLAFCFLAAFAARAQQLPQYSNYFLNPVLLNPAVAGVDSYLDLRSGYRNQWVGLRGAPTTYYLTAHMPLGRLDYMTPPSALHQEPQPKRAKYLENWRPSHRNSHQNTKAHHAVGLIAQADKAAGLRRTDVSAVYAYHVPVSATLQLSAGINAGVTQYSLNRDMLSFADPNDAVVQDQTYHRTRPNLGLGVLLHGTRFFGGVALAQIFPADFTFRENTPAVPARLQRHLFAHAGYRLSISKDVQLVPSVVVKYADRTAFSYDLNAKVYLKSFLWLGGSYRRQDAAMASVGFHLKETMHFGYSYDLTTSNLKTVSAGSHEVMVGLLLNNKQGIFSKAQYW